MLWQHSPLSASTSLSTCVPSRSWLPPCVSVPTANGPLCMTLRHVGFDLLQGPHLSLVRSTTFLFPGRGLGLQPLSVCAGGGLHSRRLQATVWKGTEPGPKSPTVGLLPPQHEFCAHLCRWVSPWPSHLPAVLPPPDPGSHSPRSGQPSLPSWQAASSGSSPCCCPGSAHTFLSF